MKRLITLLASILLPMLIFVFFSHAELFIKIITAVVSVTAAAFAGIVYFAFSSKKGGRTHRK